MKRAVWVAVAALVVIVGIGAFTQPWGAVGAQDGRSVTVHVYTLTYEDAEAGGECLPWGLVDDSLGITPWRQLIVTDASGAIVGYMDLRVGTFVTTDGQQRCEITESIALPGSPFYTFAIEGKHKRTISAGALDDLNGEIFAHVL